MRIIETFEYDVDTEDLEEVFKIIDYVNCVDDMCCPFWDGMKSPNIINHNFKVIK